jgi:tetratricopeptide (TPR) repeat protein
VSRVRRTPGQVTRQQTVEQNGREVTRNVTTYTLRSQAEVSVSYRLRRSGRLLASDTYGRGYDATAYGSNPNEARANAPTDDAIVSSLLRPIVDEVVRDVSPHRVVRELELRIGQHPGLDQGVTYMKNGRFEQAFAIWDQVAEAAQTAKDRSAALYNMGVIREVRGEYDEAFQMFSEADALTPGDETIIQALSRVEEAKAERDVLGGRAGTVRLTVRTDPPDARVRIMNIVPRYQDGIRLAPGSYDILVDAPGYTAHREWIRVGSGDEQIDVRLEPR